MAQRVRSIRITSLCVLDTLGDAEPVMKLLRQESRRALEEDDAKPSC